jgi:hypothetical protein
MSTIFLEWGLPDGDCIPEWKEEISAERKNVSFRGTE